MFDRRKFLLTSVGAGAALGASGLAPTWAVPNSHGNIGVPLPAYPDGVIGAWTGENCSKSDYRYINNEIAGDYEDTNIHPSPNSLTNESGAKHPQLSRAIASDGTNTATLAAFTGGSQPIYLLKGANMSRTISSEISLRAEIYARTDTGKAELLFGHGTKGSDVTKKVVTTEFTKIECSIGSYTSVKYLAVRNAQDGAAVNITFERLRIYDTATGKDFPLESISALFEKTFPARSSGGAFAGSVPYDKGMFDPSLTDEDTTFVATFPGGKTFQSITLACMVEIKNDTVDPFPYMSFLGIPKQISDPNASNIDAMIAVSSSARDYRLNIFPKFNSVVSEIPMTMFGQGKVHLAVAVSEKLYTVYINGVPVLEDDNHAWQPLLLDRLCIGGYSGSNKTLAQNNSRANNPFGQMIVADKKLSDKDVSDLCKIARANIVRAGGFVPPLTGMVIDGDSLSSNRESPPWFYTLDDRLKPIACVAELAVGGSNYGSRNGYNSDTRKAFRNRVLSAFVEMDYTRVLSVIQYGTNDLNNSGEMENTVVWKYGRTKIDRLFLGEIAAANKGKDIIRAILVSPPDRGGQDSSYQRTLALYQQDCVDNWQNRGYAGFIPQHTHIPNGFSSQQAAADDAIANSGNDIFSAGGVHWTPGSKATGEAGAITIARELFAPKLAAYLAAL